MVIVVLLGDSHPSAGQYENLIALTTDLEWPSACVEATSAGVATVYLVLYEPVNPSYGGGGSRTVAKIGGFEARLVAYGSAAIAGVRPAAPATVVTRNGSYGVQYSVPIDVVPGQFSVLAEVDVGMFAAAVDPVDQEHSLTASPYPCDGATGYVYLHPAEPATLQGTLVYFDAEDQLDPAVGASTWAGGPEYPSLMVEVRTVSNDSRTWGELKAMYGRSGR